MHQDRDRSRSWPRIGADEERSSRTLLILNGHAEAYFCEDFHADDTKGLYSSCAASCGAGSVHIFFLLFDQET